MLSRQRRLPLVIDRGPALRFTSADEVHQLQPPISGFGTSPDKQSIDVVDEKKLKELSQALKDDTMDEYLARYPDD